jgi:hypothetical protein
MVYFVVTWLIAPFRFLAYQKKSGNPEQYGDGSSGIHCTNGHQWGKAKVTKQFISHYLWYGLGLPDFLWYYIPNK